MKKGESMNFPYIKEGWCNRPNHIKLYIPSRTAIVLISSEKLKMHQERWANEPKAEEVIKSNDQK